MARERVPSESSAQGAARAPRVRGEVSEGRSGHTAGDHAQVVRIPLREIRINLSNPRKRFDEQELAELAESIRNHGLLQPILVRPLGDDELRRDGRKYQIVIGSRRFFAAAKVGLSAIDCYIRGMSSDEAVIASYLDHAHHRTLTHAEEGEFLRYLRDQRKMRLREIAAILDKSIAYVSRRLGVSENPELDRAVEEGRIGQAAAQEILRAPAAWWPTMIQHAEGLSSDQIRAVVNEIGDSDLSPDTLDRALSAHSKQSTAPKPPVGAAHSDGGEHARLRRHGPV